MKTAFEKHTKATRREKGRTLRERTYWSLIISTCVHQQMQIRFSLYFSIDSFFLSFFFLLFSPFFSSFPFLLLLLLPLLPRLLCLFPQPPPPPLRPSSHLPPQLTERKRRRNPKCVDIFFWHSSLLGPFANVWSGSDHKCCWPVERCSAKSKLEKEKIITPSLKKERWTRKIFPSAVRIAPSAGYHESFNQFHSMIASGNCSYDEQFIWNQLKLIDLY